MGNIYYEIARFRYSHDCRDEELDAIGHGQRSCVMRDWKLAALGAAILLAVGLFFGLGLHEHLTFEAIKTSQTRFQELYHASPLQVVAAFLATYLLVVILNLPGAAVLGLLAGAMFGTMTGTVLVSFASSTGATLACLLSRLFLRDWVRGRFPQAAAKVDHGIESEGAFYLFSLRLIPAIPFFMINLVMGLTAMPLRTFYWVSQVGMLPGTFVYVHAGSELGRLSSAAGILSPRLLAAFALLGLFPLAARKVLALYRTRSGGRDAGPKPVAGEANLEASPVPHESAAAALARQAGHVGEGCTQCKACVRQCAFLARYGTPGQIALATLSGQDGADPYACSLCGLCGAVCPEKLSPAALFLAMRRHSVDRGQTDLARYAAITAYERRGHSALFSWYPPGGCRKVFFPGCTLPGTRPQITWRFFQALRQDIPDLGVVLDCCHKPSHDLGRQDYFLERFGAITRRLAGLGVEEVLVACPNCYKIFAAYGGPLKVTTIYEALARIEADPGPGTCRVTVHDPCPLRHEPGIQDAVRVLLASRGVGVREMQNAGRSTLCCGEGGSVGFHNPALAKAWGEKRKGQARGDCIVTYCAGCAEFLGRLTRVSHLGEILFEPEKALAGKCRAAKAPVTYLHRLLLKRRLEKLFRSAQQGKKG